MLKKRSSERIEFIRSSYENEKDDALFDLSEGGACCSYDKEKKKGDIVTVTVKELSLKAKVVFCRERGVGYRLGLQFFDVPRDKLNTLTELIERFSRGVPLTAEVKDDDSAGNE